MNAAALKRAVMQRRLEDMQGLLDYLRTRADVSAEDLRDQLEVRLAVERALSQLVDLATSINAHVVTTAGRLPPADYASSFGDAAAVGLIGRELAARLAPSAGLRNVLVHEYATIDLERVASSLPQAIDGFDAYVRQAATFLRDTAGRSTDR